MGLLMNNILFGIILSVQFFEIQLNEMYIKFYFSELVDFRDLQLHITCKKNPSDMAEDDKGILNYNFRQDICQINICDKHSNYN